MNEKVQVPNLKQGSSGPWTMELQKNLRNLGYAVGSIDGIFGKDTDATVKAFQQAHHIENDGVVGTDTWDRLFSNESIRFPTTLTYIVKSGDTCKFIAKEHQTTIGEITELNNLTDDKLSIGQILKIPVIPETRAKEILKFKDKKEEVEKLQAILNKIGYSVGKIDGMFGGNTLASVQAFQKDNHLSVDGIVGPNTWKTLEKEETKLKKSD